MWFLPLLLACTGSGDPVAPSGNRLGGSDSPYLLQHADDPVNWFPWGEDAFAEAARRDVPVFVSIGYAACHWCHVMEHESFEDPIVAAYLNEHFVAVKVDREERPDVDALYMQAVYAFTGRGGWPASVWLTPDRRPIYAGTYFPAESSGGRPSFREVLEDLTAQWADRAAVEEIASGVEARLRARAIPPSVQGVPEDAVATGIAQLRAEWDPVHGGWGRAKFPNTPSLVRYLDRLSDDPALRDDLILVLDAMNRGGLHDHVGGGFHRYTVDAAWQVPHFEKMSTDNAQLLAVYAEASVRLDPHYARVAHDTAAFVLRDLVAPSGAFYSSLDADSEGGEGRYYLWTDDAIRAALGADADAFLAAYGAGREVEGGRVLARADDDPRPGELAALAAVRAGRPAPRTDTKHVVAYNGLMIGALARAGSLLGEQAWVRAAERAAAVVLAAREPDGGVPRTLADGAPRGIIDDYAFLAAGLLDLYEADLDPAWLLAADSVMDQAVQRFYDPATGLFYLADRHTSDLLVRQVDLSDGATPSGAAVALAVLVRLRAYGAPHGDGQVIQRGLEAAAAVLQRTPGSAPTLLGVVDAVQRGTQEVVLVGPEVDAFVAVYHEAPRSRSVLAVGAPAISGFGAVDGKGDGGLPARAYVCYDGICEQPTDDLERFRAQLRAWPRSGRPPR